jgi:hypothetical protein
VFEFALPETSELTDQSFTDSSQVFKLNRVVVNHGKVTDLKIDNQFMYVISSTKIKIHSIGIPKEIDAASASFSVIWPKLNGTLAPVLILGVPFLVEFDHQFAQVLTKPVTTPSLLCSRSLVYAGVFQYQLNVTTRECAGSAPNTQLCRYVVNVKLNYETASSLIIYINKHKVGVVMFGVIYCLIGLILFAIALGCYTSLNNKMKNAQKMSGTPNTQVNINTDNQTGREPFTATPPKQQTSEKKQNTSIRRPAPLESDAFELGTVEKKKLRDTVNDKPEDADAENREDRHNDTAEDAQKGFDF